MPRPGCKPFFTILALILALSLSSVPRAGASGIYEPLVFQDSGYDLVPGYTVPATLHAEGERNLAQYGFAAAALKVGDVEVGFTADPPGWGGLGGMNVYFYVLHGDRYVLKEKIDSIGYNGGKRGYDQAVTLAFACNGTLEVRTGYGVFEFDMEPVSHTIFVQYGRVDSVTIHLKSSVSFGDPTQTGNCGATGDPPSTTTYGGASIGGPGKGRGGDAALYIGIGIAAAVALMLVVRR